MTVGVFSDIPHIEMDHNSHHQNGWVPQGTGYLVSHQYDPSLTHFSYGHASKLNCQNSYEHRIDEYYSDSADPLAPSMIQYLHHNNSAHINGVITGYLTPSAGNSPIPDPQIEEDAMTCSDMSRGLSPPHSEFASPIYPQGMVSIHPQPWPLLSDLASAGGAGSSHLSLPSHHHLGGGAPFVTPTQVQNYPEAAAAGQQQIILPEPAMDHPVYQEMASPVSLALPLIPHQSQHHIAPEAQVPTTALAVPLPVAHESRSSSEDPDDFPSGGDSDSEYSPRKRNSRGKPTSKANRRAKNPRQRKPIGARNGPSSAADARRNQRGRRTGAGTGAGRRGRNSMGVETSSQAAASAARPFPCPLAPYGCNTTFASKNEWKRHVSTQHVKLGVYRCPLCPAASAAEAKQDGGPVMGLSSDFNRKDLFTQHVRRMHMSYIWPEYADMSVVDDPLVNEARKAAEESQAHRANGGGKMPLVTLSPAAERRLQELVAQGHVELRKAPSSCICPLCPLPAGDSDSKDAAVERHNPKSFAGAKAWDLRMEHMATAHLSPARRTPAANIPPPEAWTKDVKLEEWLLDQGLVEVDDAGVWKCRGVRGNGH